MSDDWPLKEWLPQKLDGRIPLTIVPIEEKGFSRGRGRNIAFQKSKGDKIFFIDTDMLFELDYVFNMGAQALEMGMASLPICFSYKNNKHEEGWWRAEGFGNVMVSRADLLKVGSWLEKGTWGYEDDNMMHKLSQVTEIWRENTPGFFHQWHPHDLAWKSRYQGICNTTSQ
jgi:glycosyltransferase involved in cell wall biosynthesis